MAPRITVRIKFDGDEYRVPGPAGTEAQAYYTNDRDDAKGTARAMWGGKSKPASFELTPGRMTMVERLGFFVLGLVMLVNIVQSHLQR